MGNFTTKEAGPSEGPENLFRCATAEDVSAFAKTLGNYTTLEVLCNKAFLNIELIPSNILSSALASWLLVKK